MKNLFVPLTLALSLTFLNSQAQKNSSDEGIRFGVRAGVNFQNITGKDDDGNKLDYALKPGFHVGVNAEIPLTNQIFVQPGLLFSTKGAKSNDNGSSSSINLSYIELPVNFVYKNNLGSGKLLVGIGPYVGYGIGGKLKYSGGGNDVSQDIKFKSSVSSGDYLANGGAYVKRFDFGLNALVGYEITENLSAQLNLQLGLTSIVPTIEGFSSDAKAKNYYFGIFFDYRF